MKFKSLFAMCLAGAALTATAQTHNEGREYFKADQFDNAKELLLRSLKNPQTDKSVSDYYLGLISLRENKTSVAANYFAEGISANAENPYNYVGQGQIALMKGDVKAAETYFKEADKHSKKDASLQIAIARAYYEANPATYTKQVKKYVEKARRIRLENPDIYIFEGDQLKANKDWGGAGAKYEMAASYDKNQTAAYVKYANLFKDVNPDYAIKMLKELLAVNPQSALGQRELANAYYNKKDYKNAVAEYSKYVKNPAHFKNDEDRYAFLLFYNQDYPQGYQYASQLLKENPKNFTALRYQFMNAAQIKDLEGQLLPMAEALYAAHKANPEANKFAPIDYTLIADEFARAKRTDDAMAVLNEAIADMPENANFNKQLAMVYVDLNDLAGASKAFKGYLDKTEEPGYNDFIQQATFLFYAGAQRKDNPVEAKKFYDEELTYLDKAAAAYPGFYKPNKMRGDIAKQSSDKAHLESAAAPYYEKAIAEYEAMEPAQRSKTAVNDAKEMYNYMGNYYLGRNDKAKAKSYFVKVLEIEPDNAEYRKFVNSL